jgi:hypothetical protein
MVGPTEGVAGEGLTGRPVGDRSTASESIGTSTPLRIPATDVNRSETGRSETDRRPVDLAQQGALDPWLHDHLAALCLARLYEPLPPRYREHLNALRRMLRDRGKDQAVRRAQNK